MALFGRLAEIAAEYLRKGSQVYIEGSLRTRKWQDKQGNERYSTEIIGNEMQMLGGRGGAGAGGAARSLGPGSQRRALVCRGVRRQQRRFRARRGFRRRHSVLTPDQSSVDERPVLTRAFCFGQHNGLVTEPPGPTIGVWF